jgi:hypothetical protein
MSERVAIVGQSHVAVRNFSSASGLKALAYSADGSRLAANGRGQDLGMRPAATSYPRSRVIPVWSRPWQRSVRIRSSPRNQRPKEEQHRQH